MVDQKQNAQDNQQKFVPNQQTENSNGERTDCMNFMKIENVLNIEKIFS
jgi:hypothetical protein